MQNIFRVKTPVFEGPLDLLLQLIEKRKLFIGDIALAKVADDFISHVQSRESFPVRDSAHFLLVAATLVLIKSKALLPALSLTDEEESDVKDLEKRLRIYKRIRGAGEELAAAFGRSMIFFKAPARIVAPVFSPDKKTDVNHIHEAITGLTRNLPKEEKVPEAEMKKVMSLEEMIDRLAERVQKSMKTSFREFSAGSKERADVVVSFLAMLELVKQGVIDVVQERQFDDITMESNSVGTPHYE